MPRHPLLPLLPLSLLIPKTTAVCYLPNGLPDLNEVNQPCFPDSNAIRMCCASNRSNPSGGFLSNGRTSDTCMENGLCKNVARDVDEDDNTVVVTEYWRDLCTSSEWPEDNCVDVCSQGDDAEVTVQVTPCDGTENSTEWCCGSSTDCCGTDAAVTIAAILPALASRNASSTSTSSTSSTSATSPLTTTTSPPTTPTPDESSTEPIVSTSDSGLSTGAKAGIGVGSAAGAILLIAAAAFLWARRRKAKTTGEKGYIASGPESGSGESDYSDKGAPIMYRQSLNPVEVHADSPNVPELVGSEEVRHEMPADGKDR
ncbi:hypothetical protein BJY00DRAFT_278949 [Aspergillus carlsbadensis]|nr:hypothetical protein BJY00DRAFT_278949 [Aspergillus carlsbadensis]